jgi:prepilin-type N-terminal cleavage/methylation domain-containing protein
MSQENFQSRSVAGASPKPVSEVLRRAGSVARNIRLFGVPQNRLGRRGYTLIEVLVVAVVIVLMLGMALPVFHAITGSRSEAGASNIIAATLGRARTDAIGLQKVIGVAFLYNPSTQLSYMAEVEFADCPAWTYNPTAPNPQTVAPLGYVQVNNAGTNTIYYYINAGVSNFPLPAPPAVPTQTWAVPTAASPMYPVGGPPLEIRQDTELLPLPSGIGVQTVCNCYFNSNGTRATDGYLNFGVILFDGHGRIVSQNYGVSAYSKLMTTSNVKTDYPSIGSSTSASPYVFYPTPQYLGFPSQFGLVVFQREAFVSQNFPTTDVVYTTSYSNQNSSTYAAQKPEEDWLDQNSTPLLLNRYTGTLIKSE